MPHIIELTDLTAPELDVFARLTEPQLRSRREAEKAVFIAESAKVISYALDAGYEPISFLMEHRHIGGQGAPLIARCEGVPVYTAPREVLSALTGYELTRGMLCAMRRRPLPSAEEVCRNARRVAVLEGVTDASNAGAIVRSAAALNMDAVLLTPTCCDLLNRRAVRVSMGTVFQIPWARIGEMPSDWPGKGMRRLKDMGFVTLAMALTDRSVSMDDPALTKLDKAAILLGTEGTGLLDETVEQSDYTVRIPMGHGVDSLNVAAAAAVAFWQLRARERRTL